MAPDLLVSFNNYLCDDRFISYQHYQQALLLLLVI